MLTAGGHVGCARSGARWEKGDRERESGLGWFASGGHVVMLVAPAAPRKKIRWGGWGGAEVLVAVGLSCPAHPALAKTACTCS